MDMEIKDLFASCKELPYSSIGKQLTMEDAIDIWKNISQYIRLNLCDNKTVMVPGIGKFYIREIQIPVGHNPPRYSCSSSPVFEISTQLATHFQIKHCKVRCKCKYPQITVNPSLIACFSNQERSKVTACMREVVAYIHRCLAQKLTAKLPIHGVGLLTFSGVDTKMTFNQMLLNQIQQNSVIKEIYHE